MNENIIDFVRQHQSQASRWRLLALCLSVFFPACGDAIQVEQSPSESLQPLSAEFDDPKYPTQLISRRWEEDPDLTFRAQAASVRISYTNSAGKTESCSGGIVGPHSVMTAAHCLSGTNGTSSPVSVRHYQPNNGDDYPTFTSKTHTCYTVFRLFADSDMALLDCDDPVGDIYGYLDYDILANGMDDMDVAGSLARANAPSHTVWWNSLTTPAYSNAIFLSTGKIERVRATDEWFRIGNYCSQGSVGSRGSANYVTNIRATGAIPGISGSVHLGPSNRIIGGPTSTAGANYAHAASLTDYLYEGNIYNPTGSETSCDTVRQLNSVYLTSQNLNPTQYYGYIDQDLNGVLDVQHDLEVAQGQGLGWLGFESGRRNSLWSRHSSAESYLFINPDKDWDGYAHLKSDGSRAVLWNDKLRLVAGNYVVLQGLVRRAAGTSKVTLGAALGTTTVTATTYTMSDSWLPFSLPFRVPAAGASGTVRLSLFATGELDVGFLNLSIAHLGHSVIGTSAPTASQTAYAGVLMRNDFNHNDERSSWTRRGGGHPLFQPDGSNIALLVSASPNVDDGRETVSDRGSVRPDVYGQYCFSAWTDTYHSYGTGAHGRLVVRAGSQTVTDQQFLPATTSARVCTPYFSVSGAPPEVSISIEGGYGSFLVDDAEFHTPTTSADLATNPYQEFVNPTVRVGSADVPPVANYLNALAYCQSKGRTRHEAFASKCVVPGGAYATYSSGAWSSHTTSSDCVNVLSAVLCR